MRVTRPRRLPRILSASGKKVRSSTRHSWLVSPKSQTKDIEAWTLLVFQDKSASAKMTYKGSQTGNKPATGDKWYTFYWFDRIG